MFIAIREMPAPDTEVDRIAIVERSDATAVATVRLAGKQKNMAQAV